MENKMLVLLTPKGEEVEFIDCGDGKTFVSKDMLFDSAFSKHAENVYEGSDIQKAVDEWFAENAPLEIKEEFYPDLLTMTEIFGDKRENGGPKFWDDEPYEQLPLFKDWRNRIKGKKDGIYPDEWATRSPYSFDGEMACYVSLAGSAFKLNAKESRGVVLCLRRVGKEAKTEKTSGGKGVNPLEIVRKRIELYENAKVQMMLYDQKILEKAEWTFDGSPSLHKYSPYERGFEFQSEEKKKIIDCVLDELKLIEKELDENEIH